MLLLRLLSHNLSSKNNFKYWRCIWFDFFVIKKNFFLTKHKTFVYTTNYQQWYTFIISSTLKPALHHSYIECACVIVWECVQLFCFFLFIIFRVQCISNVECNIHLCCVNIYFIFTWMWPDDEIVLSSTWKTSQREQS